MQAPLLLETPRLHIRLAELDDVDAIIRYYRSNLGHLAEFTPVSAVYLLPEYWQQEVEARKQGFVEDRRLQMFLFLREEPGRIIGTVNFTQFVRGLFQACYLGYNLAEDAQGVGYMTEALTTGIAYVFGTLCLHRIMANYMPRNKRSAGVLERLGFVVEGRAREYLYINEVWEDHILTSLHHPHWHPRPANRQRR